MDLDLVSADRRDTVNCFFDYQEMGLPSNRIKKQKTDLLGIDLQPNQIHNMFKR